MSTLAACLLGIAGGGLASAALTVVATRGRRCVEPSVHELTDEDREAVATEFAVHASAVHRGVSEYADVLAGGDPDLRERLRRFEGGRR